MTTTADLTGFYNNGWSSVSRGQIIRAICICRASLGLPVPDFSTWTMDELCHFHNIQPWSIYRDPDLVSRLA